MLHASSLTIKIVENDKTSVQKTFIAKEHLDMKKVLAELGYSC